MPGLFVKEHYKNGAVAVCAAVCCSVLQCVAVCCSVLQCVAVCRSVLQYVAITGPNLQPLYSIQFKQGKESNTTKTGAKQKKIVRRRLETNGREDHLSHTYFCGGKKGGGGE